MFKQLFDAFENYHIAVVGDVMLDTYWWGNTDRISPEAPVPVVALQHKESRIGGAGNVALNLVSLGAQVSMHTVTGTDEDGLLLELMMKDRGIDTEGVWKSPDRMTTNKIRIMARSQQMMRLDREISTDLEADAAQRFLQKTIAHFDAHPPHAVVLEDYNKGVLTQAVIEGLLAYCHSKQIITAVDPKKNNFFAYKGATIFKPNLKEAREALNVQLQKVDVAAMDHLHALLHERLGHTISFVTLSELGVYYHAGQKSELLPAFVRSIADVSGAGDTVIATATLVYAATQDARLMALVANLAGGLVCEEVGTAAIDANRLLAECMQLLEGEG